MHHRDIHSHMADYLEADLDLTRRALFDAHLDDCESCRREVSDLQRTISLVRSLPTPEPPPFLVERVMARVRDGEGRTSLLERARVGLAAFASPRLALPAAALVVGLLMASGDFGPETLSSPDRVTAVELARSDAASAYGRASEGETTSPVLIDGLAARRRALSKFQPLSIPGAAPPPAVARAPRLQIPLYADASGGAGSWTARSPRGSVTGFGSGQVLSIPVASRRTPGLGQAAVSGTAVGSSFAMVSADAEREERKRAELERQLAHLTRQPGEFSANFARLTTAEQEIWLRALAEYAREVGRAEEVLGGLHLNGDPYSLELATAFMAELRQVDGAARAKVAAAGD